MISYLLLILAIPLLIYLFKDIYSFYCQYKYIQQGFAYKFVPVFGAASLFIKGRKYKNQYKGIDDEMQAIIKTKQKNDPTKQVPGLVLNKSSYFGCAIFLTDPELIREFQLKENDVCTRMTTFDLKVQLGLFISQGEYALRQRRIFSDFFRIDNLDRMIPLVRSSIRKHLISFSSSKPSESDSDKLISDSILDLATMFMFSTGCPPPATEKGQSVGVALIDLLGVIISPKIGFNRLNALMWDIPNKFNLTDASRKCQKEVDHLRSVLKKYINQRREYLEANQGDISNATLNITDSMILHNMKATNEDEKLSDEEIISNCNVFLLASFDTTITAGSSLLHILSQNPDLQSRIREEIVSKGLDKDGINFETLDSSPVFNDLIRECMRINPSAFLTFFKRINKDFTLGKYNFYKNDIVMVPMGTLMWSPEYFPKGRTFELGSINNQNKRNYMPFWGGKRGCVGQFLAEMELKLLAIEALKIGTLVPLTKTEDTEYHLSITAHLVNAKFALVPHASK